MKSLKSVPFFIFWISVSLGYYDDCEYELKGTLGSNYQKPSSCGDYFKNSNITFEAIASDSFSNINIPEINLEELYLRPLSYQARNVLDMMSYEDFEQAAQSSFRHPHQILNYYAVHNHPSFKRFIKLNCDQALVASHLRSIKKRYCTEKEFHERANQLPFDLFQTADDLLEEIAPFRSSIEIEDFYHEYKYFSHKQSSSANRYNKRCKALTQRYTTITKETWIHPLTERLLKENSIKVNKFKEFKGNAFQIQLYEEFVEILDQTSKLTHCNSFIRPYISDLVALVNVGQSLNREGYLVKAATIADYCWSSIAAVGEGVALGASDLVNFIMHPIDSTAETIATISSLAYHLGRLFHQIAEIGSLASLQHIELQYEGNYEELSNKSGIQFVLGNEANQKIEIFFTNCSSITRALYKQVEDLSWRDKTKYFFGAATEIFLTKKCAKVLHSISNKTAKQAAQIIKDAQAITAEAELATPSGAMVRIVGQAASIAHDLAEEKQFVPTSLSQFKNIYSAYYVPLSQLKNNPADQFLKQFSDLSSKDIETMQIESVRGCFEPVPLFEGESGCGDVQQPKIEDFILINPMLLPELPDVGGCFKPVPISEIENPGCGEVEQLKIDDFIFKQENDQDKQLQNPDRNIVPPDNNICIEEDREKSKNKIPDDPVVTKHIFRSKSGHIQSDTPTNRKLLEDVANNPNNYLGPDKYGQEWYGYIQLDGTQVWVAAWKGLIKDGGINEVPHSYDPETGLSRSLKKSK